MRADCFSCGRKSLDRNSIAINQKLRGKKLEHYYCIDCLADYLGCSVQDIQDKIEEFKDEGCKMFD